MYRSTRQVVNPRREAGDLLSFGKCGAAHLGSEIELSPCDKSWIKQRNDVVEVWARDGISLVSNKSASLTRLITRSQLLSGSGLDPINETSSKQEFLALYTAFPKRERSGPGPVFVANRDFSTEGVNEWLFLHGNHREKLFGTS